MLRGHFIQILQYHFAPDRPSLVECKLFRKFVQEPSQPRREARIVGNVDQAMQITEAA